jgi:hypothetical protein
MKKLLAFLVFAVTVTVSFLVGITAPSLFPGLPSNAPALLAFSMSMILLYAGCSFLFFLGLKNFTANFKGAYVVFCAGILMLALAESQLPVFTAMNMQDILWMRAGGILLPVIAAIITMYIGARKFARLFNIQTVWNKGWFVLLVAMGMAAAAYFLPIFTALGPETEIEGRATLAFMGISLAIFLACAILAYKVKNLASKTYKKAFFWFYVALAGFVVVTLQTIAAVMIVGPQSWWLKNGYTIFIQVILGLPLLKAAYEFMVLEDTVAPSDQPTVEITILDIVVVAAEKVSNAKAIEPQLERVREITARLAPDQKVTLNSSEIAELAEIYRHIEHYLTVEEPVRRFTKDELRQSILKESGASNPAIFNSFSYLSLY